MLNKYCYYFNLEPSQFVLCYYVKNDQTKNQKYQKSGQAFQKLIPKCIEI